MTATTALDLTPAVVRQRAANLIRARGWERGRFLSPSGRLCMVEAIGQACGLPHEALASKRRLLDVPEDAYDAADNIMDAVATELGRDPSTGSSAPRWWLACWQDWPDRTVDQVLAALEQRIKGAA